MSNEKRLYFRWTAPEELPFVDDYSLAPLVFGPSSADRNLIAQDKGGARMLLGDPRLSPDAKKIISEFLTATG